MEKRSTQLLKGVLDMLLLAFIDREPCYGYEMVQKLHEKGLELVSEGSIYPLLGRLEKNGFVEGYFVRSDQGPNRKYYRILPRGREHLKKWTGEWREFAQAVQQILDEGVDEAGRHNGKNDQPGGA
ncbi:PadR family transcriptional regulator [Kyrpidia spormannii]|uniref:Transcriptional regulator, PadR-like family n=2 Tax=Kyrpidia spormannii TaxID=2055160 RepID=A0ACA8Z5B6_9BACL|nr:PadR family transcriptional regulator [Kyrpidia spormannii]CAB3389464.1 Transcriptional regulator, PadR-like family [Kyrpidia spormannii]CAB3390212.1 PadR family transcriptional regulator PadR [Kyrpidia spormannii]